VELRSIELSLHMYSSSRRCDVVVVAIEHGMWTKTLNEGTSRAVRNTLLGDREVGDWVCNGRNGHSFFRICFFYNLW